MFLSCCNFVPFLQFVINDPSAVLIYFGLFSEPFSNKKYVIK